MYLVTATKPAELSNPQIAESKWEGRNELPAAKSLAQGWLNTGHTDVTIWKRVAICELETKMVFKETNGTPMEPEIL